MQVTDCVLNISEPDSYQQAKISPPLSTSQASLQHSPVACVTQMRWEVIDVWGTEMKVFMH